MEKSENNQKVSDEDKEIIAELQRAYKSMRSAKESTSYRKTQYEIEHRIMVEKTAAKSGAAGE